MKETEMFGSGFSPRDCGAAMRLVRGSDTGTDLMVTYQRPLGSAPPTFAGPHVALYNRQPNIGLHPRCCAQEMQTELF